MSFATRIIDYFTNLDTDWDLPAGVSLLDPFADSLALPLFQTFYHQYFDSDRPRIFLLGINPGRHGAGVTGIPFTDPRILTEVCNIPNDLPQKYELSALYIYDLIEAYGGPAAFYQDVYINSVCPLGFVKDGINCNYYDDPALQDAVTPYILDGIQSQIACGTRTDVAISLGKGKNFKFLKKFNQEHKLFDEVIALPHPRWVMQYRRKLKDQFIQEAVDLLRKYCA